MEIPNKKNLHEIMSVNQFPCLSLYMPTHRTHPDNIQDPIRYKNLVKQLKESLLLKYPASETVRLIEPFEKLSEDYQLWNHMLDGLAVFGTTNLFKTYRIPMHVKEFVIVADSFHTKPIRRYLQSADRFQLLGLTLIDIQLFEGNRHSLSEIDLAPGIPKTIKEALGEEMTDKHLTFASYGGAGGPSMVHGHGDRKEELEIDAERFFRTVSSAIADNYSKPSGLPLILCALPEHHSLFQNVSNNPYLLPKGIPVNPKSVSPGELALEAWKVVEPGYQHRIKKICDQFEYVRSHGKGSDIIMDIVKAATEGRVNTLLIEAERKIGGRLDKVTGTYDSSYLSDPEVDDLLDDIGELVTRNGGEVLVIPKEELPSETGAAAIFRY